MTHVLDSEDYYDDNNNDMTINKLFLELRKTPEDSSSGIVNPFHSNKKKKVDQQIHASTNIQQNRFIRPQNINKHNTIPKQSSTSPTAAILSDLDKFRQLLCLALCYRSTMHHWDKLRETDRDTGVLSQAISNFLELFDKIIYRGDDTVDTSTTKVHSHKNAPNNIQQYGSPAGWNCSTGERGLKTWAKLVSKTAQKQRLNAFTLQTSFRVTERLMMQRVKEVYETNNSKNDDNDTASIDTSTKWGRKQPHYIYDTKNKITWKLSAKGKKFRIQTPFHKQIVTALSKWEKDRHVSVWNDVIKYYYGEKQLFRASHNYDKFGSYYDWVTVTYDNEAHQDDPAKLLLMYETSTGKKHALILPCCWHGINDRTHDTMISTRYRIQFHTNNYPQILSVPIDDINYGVFGMEHMKSSDVIPGKVTSKEAQKKYQVDIVLPQSEWVHQFMSYGKTSLP